MAGIKRDAADKWFSDCIRHRAGYACEHCHKQFLGLEQGFECCHIYGRANKSTRWYPGNCVALCSGCHRRFTEHPMDFTSWVYRHFGHGHVDLLFEKRREIFKTTKSVRTDISRHYRNEFRHMVKENSRDLVGY